MKNFFKRLWFKVLRYLLNRAFNFYYREGYKLFVGEREPSGRMTMDYCVEQCAHCMYLVKRLDEAISELK